MLRALELLLCAAGIYGSYLTYGYLQEAIYQVDEHDGTRFTFTSSLLALQCLVNTIIGFIAYSAYYIVVSIFGEQEEEERKPQSPRTRSKARQEKLEASVSAQNGEAAKPSMFGLKAQWEFMLLALAYLAAMGFSNESIKFVSYPTQALAKSCKTIPVMLSRVFFLGKKYPLSKYICVIVMVAGIGYFQLARIKSKEASPVHESHVDDEYAALYRTLWGYFLLFGSLACDAYTGPNQESLKHRFEFHPLQLMALQNMWACAMATGAALCSGELYQAINYVIQHPNLIHGLLLFSLTSAFGQIFIFITVIRFDSLVLTTVTTTRKFLTILVSVFAHGHFLSLGQWLAVCAVFGALVFDSFKERLTTLWIRRFGNKVKKS
eukprot:gb/GECG01006288.1/.p1 GENE.gb/GECG01006288.1/~~gb/GECG01006288.1/.p1  ORF type:complete len:378 (+),score=36.30 gb/GECG01006288.1/:1-1134(+)